MLLHDQKILENGLDTDHILECDTPGACMRVPKQDEVFLSLVQHLQE